MGFGCKTFCNSGYGLKAAAFAGQSLLRGALWFLLIVPLGAAAQKNSLDARLEQAVQAIRQNRIAEAEQQLNSILKTAPNEARALNLLGTIRGSQRRFDEAETFFVRAIGSDPQLAGAHMNLAYLYML